MPTGTHTVADLLSITSMSAVDYGLEEIGATLRADLAAYNAIMDTMIADLAEPSTDRERI